MIGFLKTSPKVSFTADKKTFTDLGGGTAVVVKVRVCESRLHRLTASFSEGWDLLSQPFTGSLDVGGE